MGRDFLKLLLGSFRTKYRISFREPHDNKEAWYLFLSPANMVLGFVSTLLLMFVFVVALMIYTPILDMLPGYPGGKARDILLENVLRLDSLQQQIELWDRYRHNITQVMDGKTPMPVTSDIKSDGQSASSKDIVSPSVADSLFRSSAIVGELAPERVASRPKYELYTPAHGVVLQSFDPTQGQMGVVVSAKGHNEVIAASDGVVLFDMWSPSDGNVVAIQHGGNLVSIYKNLSRVLKLKGESVSAGEVIGAVGGEQLVGPSTSDLTIELWDNGTAADPEKYMLF